MEQLTRQELDSGLDHILASPTDNGTVELIVRRPALGKREILDQGDLDLRLGLLGDTWIERGSRRSEDGGPHPDMQLNIMNARVAALLAQSPERWALAGDQLYVDLDLSTENLPPWTRLALGSAVIEVTDQPHNGCAKFAERFGKDAVRFVNSPIGKEHHFRGINAKVVQPGAVRRGATIHKL